MLTQSKTVKTLAASVALIATLGLGAVLGSPGVALAQEDTTTTVVEDSTDATTDTTTPDTDGSDRPARGDHDCEGVPGESDTSATA